MKLDMKKKQSVPETLIETVMAKKQHQPTVMEDLGLFILRLTVGGLLAGHGSQKLFGWFSGPGLKGTAAWLESMGLQPGTSWATAASASEFGGGVLTTLGLLHPLGPLGMMGAMIMATVKAHWGKPIWASQGGAELPVINMSTALALTLTGPGRWSLDYLFGIRLPRSIVITVAIVETGMIAIGFMSRPTPPQASLNGQESTTEPQSGQTAGTR